MSEKKKSRKQLRKEQKEALEKAQRENSLKTDFDAENILKKNRRYNMKRSMRKNMLAMALAVSR